MDFVARGTCNIAALVCTSLPVHAFHIFLVAGKTSRILYFYIARRVGTGGCSLGSEKDVRDFFGLVFRCWLLPVFFGLAMTRLTGGGMGIRPDTMFILIEKQNRLGFGFVVAFGTHRVLFQGCRRPLGLSGQRGRH